MGPNTPIQPDAYVRASPPCAWMSMLILIRPPPRSPPRPFASNKVSIIGVECTSSLWSCHDMQKLSPHELHTGTLPIIILNVEVFQCCVVVMIQCYNITSHECIKIRLSVHGRSIFPILFPRESQ